MKKKPQFTKKSLAGDVPKHPGSLYQYIAKNNNLNKDGTFRCPNCWGAGRVVAPWEQPCPVEGYKLADRIACPTCNGKKIVAKALHKPAYKSAVERYQLEKIRYNSRLELAEKLISRFSQEEIDKLRELNYRL